MLYNVRNCKGGSINWTDWTDFEIISISRCLKRPEKKKQQYDKCLQAYLYLFMKMLKATVKCTTTFYLFYLLLYSFSESTGDIFILSDKSNASASVLAIDKHVLIDR